MDRFVTREPRNDREFLQQGNRVMAYPSNAPVAQNNFMPTEMYHGGYGAEFPSPGPIQRGGGRFGAISMGLGSLGAVGGLGGTPQMGMPFYASAPLQPEQPRMVSGIDSQYLAAYDSGPTIMAGQQRMQSEHSIYNPNQNQMVTGNYNYRSLSGPDGGHTFVPQMVANPMQVPQQTHQFRREEHNQQQSISDNAQKFIVRDLQNNFNLAVKPNAPNQQDELTKAPVRQSTEASFVKNEFENPTKTRFDKLKELHRSGPRVFSGPVEKVLKWHKSLQDLGLLIIYEVVAKCVSIRQGEWCSKHLVIRDDQGPAMQVVYYEIDFLLPELKPPCTIRVVGRMVGGTSRLHAFSARAATGDDVATLPRRAAVAAHHVAKLYSQYSSNVV